MDRCCEMCGQTFNEVRMMSFNTGRKTHWYCWDCWKKGQGEAAGCEMIRKKKALREAQKRK